MVEILQNFVAFSEYINFSREGNKSLRNLHRIFLLCSTSQIYSGDFAKFCGLLRIYQLNTILLQRNALDHFLLSEKFDGQQFRFEERPKKKIPSEFTYIYILHNTYIGW